MRRGRRLLNETRGAVMVEHLIAFLPVLFFGLSVWELIELWAGDLLVRRAASAAARAAVVVLADDPRFYDGLAQNQFRGARRRDIELAATLVLATSPHFSSKPEVSLSFGSGHEPLTATVSAAFHCFTGWVSVVCGGSARTLRASATYRYQGAHYAY